MGVEDTLKELWPMWLVRLVPLTGVPERLVSDRRHSRSLLKNDLWDCVY